MTNPLHPYVRFYLATLSQLDEVHAALAGTAEEIRAAAAPFADVMAAAADPDLASLRDGPQAALSTAGLWRPQDPATLTGIVDVYDVVGRFTFQGEDDANLRRLEAAVGAALGEVKRQRLALAALARLPAAASRHAEGLSQQELAEADAERARRLEPFEPLAARLREHCTRVLDAIRLVPRPDLADLATADALYGEYTRRLQALYTAGLPYLRRALQELCAAADVEVPPSWPDVLPFAPHLPAELVTPPPDETPQMAEARAQLEALAARDAAAARRVEELVVAQRRIEAERAAVAEREAEVLGDVAVAKQLVRWATRHDELDAALAAIEGQGQQKQSRAALIGQLYVQHQQAQAVVTTLQAEVAQRENEAAAAAAAFEKERASPPTFFGKDEWKARVEDLEREAADRRATLAQRQAVLAQQTADLSALAARAQAEQAQIALIDRAIDEARARAEALREDIAQLEDKLGTHKPARRLTVAQADEHLLRTWQVRTELRARLDELGQRQRDGQDEVERNGLQRRQHAAERQRLEAQLAQAAAEVEAGRAEALAALAQRRKAGFLQHVGQVLAPLEQSLTQVDKIFIEPARQVLLQRPVGEAPKAGSLRAQAEGLAQAVAQLTPRVEPVLAAQIETLKRVQQEFCDRVQDAVRAAWDAG